MASVPVLDRTAENLARRLRQQANTGNRPEAMQELLHEAANRIESDALFRSRLKFCARGCDTGQAAAGNPLFGFGDNSPFL